MNIFNSVSELVGKTPLLKLNSIIDSHALCASVFVKLEFFNPAGSVKDRVAMQMIEDAEKSGEIKSGATLIEATSGNTGIGICALAAAKGYKAVIIMPETMSEERKKLMRAYGAELVLTSGEKGMQGAIDKANELCKSIDGAFLTRQFENESNSKAHFLTTGPEIYEDMDGKVDIFVAGVGTGGTLTGVGRYLKSKNPDIKIVAVEPEDSPVLTEGRAGAHAIAGIGAGFVPKVLDTEVYDEVVCVSANAAYDAARELAKSEGILVGISSGAALYAAMRLANKEQNKGKNIVVLLADGGERYLSTELF